MAKHGDIKWEAIFEIIETGKIIENSIYMLIEHKDFPARLKILINKRKIDRKLIFNITGKMPSLIKEMLTNGKLLYKEIDDIRVVDNTNGASSLEIKNHIVWRDDKTTNK